MVSPDASRSVGFLLSCMHQCTNDKLHSVAALIGKTEVYFKCGLQFIVVANLVAAEAIGVECDMLSGQGRWWRWEDNDNNDKIQLFCKLCGRPV